MQAIVSASEIENFLSRQRFVLGHKQVSDFGDLDGSLFATHDGFYEVDIDSLQSWQVKFSIDSQETNSV